MKILLIHDRSLLREALSELLRRLVPVCEVQHASGLRGTVETVAAASVDLYIAGGRFLACESDIQRLRATNPSIPCLALVESEAGPVISPLLRAGAAGVISTKASPEEFEKAILSVASGQLYLSNQAAQQVALQVCPGAGTTSAQGGSHPRLTSREVEVLRHISNGLSTREIAVRLGLSVKTVESHRGNIMRKTDRFSIAGLTKYAIQAGLTEAPTPGVS